MLQQTQVATVIPYYRRFLEKYPTVQALAAASEEEVLQLWAGLGYYSRGRNLHKAAQEIALSGFPSIPSEIEKLPGVGRSTAAAIAAFAFGERAAILDGNVKRVLARCFATNDKRKLWLRAESLLPKTGVETYTQALMDLGATVCTRRNPQCGACPIRQECVAHQNGWADRFPAPRARKALPLQQTTWWVVVNRAKVLMEKRPSPGIWGGLLAFPQTRPANTIVRTRLPLVEHGFTHFRLRATPVLCSGREVRLADNQRWLEIGAAIQAPVPSPVKTLLEKLR
jgi:A/G-specific adenine glycosylase